MNKFLMYLREPIPSLVAICLGCVLLTTFSSFNTTHLPLNASEKHTISVIQCWYSLFLKLEEKDSCAHPPIAARRASEMGLAGFYVYEQQRATSPFDDRKTGILLNEVYARVLQEIFMHQNDEINQIRNLQYLQRKKQRVSGEELKEIQYKADVIIAQLNHTMPCWSTYIHEPRTDQKASNSSADQPSDKRILPSWKYQPVYVFENRMLEIKDPVENSEASAPFLKDALAVYYASHQLTEEQKWMADFWSDDVRGLTFSPPDRWISIALQLMDQHQSDFKTAIELLAKLGIGLNDAVTLCWKYKYTYNLERPQTIIRTHMDSLWQPYHENPDFPSYPSGHAVIGSTASAILINYFGDQISFTDRTHESRIEFMGKPRHYRSITAMEKENAWSRIYMGVHYPSDCSEGMRLGREVGVNLINLDLNRMYFNSIDNLSMNSSCYKLVN